MSELGGKTKHYDWQSSGKQSPPQYERVVRDLSDRALFDEIRECLGSEGYQEALDREKKRRGL